MRLVFRGWRRRPGSLAEIARRWRARTASGDKFKRRAVERTAHLHRVGSKSEPSRQRKFKAVAAAADAGALQIFAVAGRQTLADHPPAGIDVETDRRLGMIEVLCPAGNALRADEIDITAQHAALRLVP